MLDTIPPEVLGLVAYHLSIESLQPPTAILQSSTQLNDSLSPRSNPNLYARIFKDSFDTSAATRRCSSPLTAKKLTDELERRTRALGRLKRRMRVGNVGGVEDRDLWVIYILLIEHDEKNMNHLFNDEFNLLNFLKSYYRQNLLVGAVEAGWPTETVGRSLIMWIAWILFNNGIGRDESQEEEDERLFILRPYVFAAQKYDLYYGPWTIHDLPLSTSNLEQPLGMEFDHPFKADLKPKSRGVTIPYYGEEVILSPPVLAHAAILRFFKRDYDDEDESGDEDEDMDEQVAAPFISMNIGTQLPDHGSGPQVNPTSDPKYIGNTYTTAPKAQLTSQSHDRDWDRLKSCYDASTSSGMKVKDWRNAFDGCWEGNFSFFEFAHYKEMLAGNSRALYEGPFGEQAQVWKLTETFVRPKSKAKPPVVPVDDDEMGQDGKRDKGKGNASPTSTSDHEARTLPFNGPATNAGFPADLPTSTSAGLATPSAEQVTLAETIKTQVEAIEGYEIVPAEELDEACTTECPGLEILLTGTGHSAWGRFILKGRVRAWDGMATLVKEYAPDSRGKWIYRGYVTAGDVFVGRWRDTFTPEDFYGYEGTFILNRRE